MSSANKEVDECGTGARWPPITEKQLSCALAFVKKREPFQDGKRLDDWLRIMEDVLKTLELSTAQHFVFWKPTISRTNLFCACSELCTSWAWLKWMRSKGRELELACLVQH